MTGEPRPKIVAIDDDSAALGLARAFLTSQGWSVSTAQDGQSGLDQVRSVKPDIILLDINLPDMDGFAVCAKLKEDASLRDIPIVFISGARKEAEDILKGLDPARGDAFIIKPVHLSVLKAKLEAVLRPRGAGAP